MRKKNVGAAGLPPLAGEMSEGQGAQGDLNVQTSPSRSRGTREAKRPAGGARAPLRSAAMRKNTVGAAGLPPLAGEMSEGQRGHKAISTTYNPSPPTGEVRHEGDRATFVIQRR